MKILHVTPRLPYPPLRGDHLVAYHRLEALGQRHELTLLSLVEDDPDAEALAALGRFCGRIEVVRLRRWRSVADVAAAAPLSRLPLQVLYYRSRELARRLDALLAADEYDLVHAYFLRLAPYLASVRCGRVLDLMDSLELRLGHQVRTERAPRRWLFREELRRIGPFERTLSGAADQLLVVSERDAASFPEAKVTVVPNGVDADAFAPLPGATRRFDLVFSGNMGYAPNAQAARWFVEECLPLVRATVPEASLAIVGARPLRTVRALGRVPGVHVTGYVDSVARALNEAAVAVAPLRAASGIQNKVLEAMACGRPVVTTALGLGDIEARPGDEVIVADGAEPFARAVVELLRSPERAEALGRRGRDFVVRRHSWERAADAVEDVYRLVLERGRSPAAAVRA